MEWIKFKDRKPENKQKILVSDGEIVTAAEYVEWMGETYFDGCELGGYEWEWDFDPESLTHWAELPEPPKE